MQGKKKLLLFEKEFILQFWISIIYQLDSIGINNNRFEYNTKKKKNRNWFFTNIILSSFKVFPSFFSLFNYPIIPTLIHPLYVFPFFFLLKSLKEIRFARRDFKSFLSYRFNQFPYPPNSYCISPNIHQTIHPGLFQVSHSPLASNNQV